VISKTKKPAAENESGRVRPIELVIENGFSILRPWEIDRVPPPSTKIINFIVRHSGSQDREVVVEFADQAPEQLSTQVRNRVASWPSFWTSCAERHLAHYLSETGTCPPDNKLLILHLDPEDMSLALRWRH
jgi:hypothetical protein